MARLAPSLDHDAVGASLSGEAALPSEKKAAGLTVPQVRRLLQVVLPKRQLGAETAIALIQHIQDQNYRAYCADRKRRLRRRDTS